MTVTNISSAANQQTNAVQSPRQQPGKDFKALQSALQSGDLSAAQTAFTALQQDMANNSQTSSAASSGSSTSASTSTQSDLLSSGFQALQTALQSGSLSGAQTAFATLQQDMQANGAVMPVHSGHHHRGADNISGVPGSARDSASTTSAEGVSPLLDTQA